MKKVKSMRGDCRVGDGIRGLPCNGLLSMDSETSPPDHVPVVQFSRQVEGMSIETVVMNLVTSTVIGACQNQSSWVLTQDPPFPLDSLVVVRPLTPLLTDPSLPGGFLSITSNLAGDTAILCISSFRFHRCRCQFYERR
jgi:hypothetical protein